jgi:phosphatidylglycerophosphate synthase
LLAVHGAFARLALDRAELQSLGVEQVERLVERLVPDVGHLDLRVADPDAEDDRRVTRALEVRAGPLVDHATDQVHWLGDSLDGTLARVRRAERPRYGYYLDHLADAVATALVGLGLGLSAHMHLTAGLVLVIAYLALSINSYLETQALGRFTLGYGRLGPTEARLALIALLSAVALGAEVSLLGLTLLDLVALGGAGMMAVALAGRAFGNLRALAEREPYAAP